MVLKTEKSVIFVNSNTYTMGKKILITNDDGIDAPGLKVLAEVARNYGEVKVLAPRDIWSSKSHSITLERPLRIERFRDLIPGVEVYITDGSPVDSIKLGIEVLYKRQVDLILTGVNHGANYSVNMFYSATVAAALEGCFHGIRSIAFSITTLSREIDMERLRKILTQVMERLESEVQWGKCFNVTIPAEGEIKGIKFDRASYGRWEEQYLEMEHPVRKEKYYWLSGKFINFEPEATDTDVWSVEHGYVSVVPISLTMSDNQLLHKIKQKISV